MSNPGFQDSSGCPHAAGISGADQGWRGMAGRDARLKGRAWGAWVRRSGEEPAEDLGAVSSSSSAPSTPVRPRTHRSYSNTPLPAAYPGPGLGYPQVPGVPQLLACAGAVSSQPQPG